MENRTATRALRAAIVSYVYGFATVLISASSDSRHVMDAFIPAIFFTIVLNTVAIVLGRKALRSGDKSTTATVAIWLGGIGYVGSALLFVFLTISRLATVKSSIEPFTRCSLATQGAITSMWPRVAS